MARILLIAVLAVVLAGCGSTGVDVKATGEDGDVFRAPEAFDDEKEAARPTEDGQPRRRTPFITLDAYDWDYDAFLAELKSAVAGLDLPRSAETRVVLGFRSSEPEPTVTVECGSTPVECADLRNRLEAWPGWPPLPAGCPHGQLQVVLSNLP